MTVIRVWIGAIRPKTLPAGAMPVLLGTALAAADGTYSATAAAATLACSALMQIASNFINEIYDNRRGADSGSRVGPTRAVAAGLISERSMAVAAAAALLGALCIGLYLTAMAGWGIFMAGCVSLFAAWAYTGGKYPLAYLGLGEVTAFVFYGVVAVCGTYYIHTHTITAAAVWLSVAPAAFAANILAVNNIRDVDTDRAAGKKTAVVRFGAQAGRRMYATLYVVPFVVPFALVRYGYSESVLLTLALLPFAVWLTFGVFRRDGATLNPLLAGTGGLLTVYAVLMCAALMQ